MSHAVRPMNGLIFSLPVEMSETPVLFVSEDPELALSLGAFSEWAQLVTQLGKSSIQHD